METELQTKIKEYCTNVFLQEYIDYDKFTEIQIDIFIKHVNWHLQTEYEINSYNIDS